MKLEELDETESTPRLLIFQAIKELILCDDFKITYAEMDELSEMTCGVYVRASESPSNRQFSGEYLVRNASVTFNIHTNKKIDGLIIGDKYCEYIVKNMQTLFNYEYTNKNNESIYIIKTDMIGDVNYIGKNEQGIQVYSINFNIKYGG